MRFLRERFLAKATSSTSRSWWQPRRPGWNTSTLNRNRLSSEQPRLKRLRRTMSMSNRFRSSKKDLDPRDLKHGPLIQNAIRSSIVVISTGTPPGVGMAQKPPVFLRPWSSIRLGIKGLEEQNRLVVSEP